MTIPYPNILGLHPIIPDLPPQPLLEPLDWPGMRTTQGMLHGKGEALPHGTIEAHGKGKA